VSIAGNHREQLPQHASLCRLRQVGGVNHRERVLCDDSIAVVGLTAALRGSFAQVLDTNQRIWPSVLLPGVLVLVWLLLLVRL
jgi:phosphatidylserine/phosphatidylglycerophosphate/cardiolipin synthase-like enzyme